ncbi:pyrophosphatase PpaX [Priestia megaterium]|nr:pyrophosphatase PpaX [Priestia megaterium]
MNINTVLFDLDGTLIDTNELIISSFTHTLNHYYPNQYTRQDILAFMGPPLYDTFAKMDQTKVQEMIDMYRTHNLSHHDSLVKEFEGVFETVKWLYDQKYKLAIVTTKQLNTVMMGLRLTKLDQFFDVIVSIEDVEHAKPHPEPIEKALSLLNAKPEETLMVGDNHHDIVAGQNARTKTAGVAWSAKGREHIASYSPDIILEKMTDLITFLGGK